MGTVRRVAIDVAVSRCGNGGWNVGKFSGRVMRFWKEVRQRATPDDGETNPTVIRTVCLIRAVSDRRRGQYGRNVAGHSASRGCAYGRLAVGFKWDEF